MIKRLLRSALVPAGLAVLLLTANDTWGQTNDNTDGGRRRNRRRAGGGNNQGQRDPAQIQERITARIRERLEITNDDDWKTIQPLIEKVQQAQREARVASLGGRRRANDNNGGSDPNGNNNRRNRFNGEEGLAPNADVLALREAVDSNAPVTDIKPKLAKVRALIKERQAALAKAQDNLRKALTPRQEAIAALMGLLR